MGDAEYMGNQNCRKCNAPKSNANGGMMGGNMGGNMAGNMAGMMGGMMGGNMGGNMDGSMGAMMMQAMMQAMGQGGMSPMMGAAAGGANMRPGDWNCAKCGDHQFAKNMACRKCDAPKQPGNVGVPMGGQGGNMGGLMGELMGAMAKKQRFV